MPAEKAAATLQELQLEVEEEFGARQAESCGALMGTRRDLGLSLGDCVCLTTAAWLGAVAVTADRRWKELEGTVVNGGTIRVELIR
jgi:PIN domain nuclease of toxin-antitoxin system